MLPTGDTTSHAAHNWAHAQAAYIGGSVHHVLLVLTHHAFYKSDNPEHAPVGQVLLGYSSLPVLQSWCGISQSSLQRALWALQAEHGYITRTPRPYDGESGRPPRIIQVFWTAEDDATRNSFRDGRSALPDEFVISARQIERRHRVPDLRLYRNDGDVEQV